MEIEEVIEDIKLNGPDRVVVNEFCDTESPQKARELWNVTPTIIYIRNDEWSLGAADPFEVLAYEQWKHDWAYVLLRTGDYMTIEVFLNTMEQLSQPRH